MSKSYYDAKYFEWQKTVGELGGIANLFKFEKYIKEDDDVLDFGCGGGYLLKNINTRGKKVGIDINPAALATAKENGVICFDDIRKVEDDSIDVLITNHALEHVEEPIIYVREFRRVVRNGGKVVIVVPHEVSEELNPCDINMELHTWSPQNLYNLLTVCKIDTLSCERLYHAWSLSDLEILEKAGLEEFHRISKLRAEQDNLYQTMAVGIVLKNGNEDDTIIRSSEGIYKKHFAKINEEWNSTKRIIEKYEKCAIYGAGTAGKKIYNFFIENGLRPNCFVVSNAEGNEKEVMGMQVIPLNELTDKEDYLFVIAVMDQKTKASIIEQLKNIGCEEILDFNIGIIDYLNKLENE